MKGRKSVAAAKGTSNNTKIINVLQTIRKTKGVPLSAAMTVEASIALPLFIFFFINIMSAISIIRIQSETQAALHQTGSHIMQMAFDIKAGEEVLSDEDNSSTGIVESGGLTLFAASDIRRRLSDKIDGSSVMDGIKSLNFLSSKIMQQDDIIDIVVDYKVHPVVSVPGFKGFLVESRFYGHAFTGYDLTNSVGAEVSEEEMVYVTEYGEVYHRDISCRYLNPSVKSVPFGEIEGLRNKDRSKYYACEYCGKSVAGGNVFITSYGECYHSRVDCPGLKRKIYTIPISEVGGRSPCSGCG